MSGDAEEFPMSSPTKVEARTTSRVVTPKILLLSQAIKLAFPCVMKGPIPLGVIDTEFFEYLSNNGNGRVHGVGDDEDECLGRSGRDPSGKILDNSSIDLPRTQSDFLPVIRVENEIQLTLNRSSLITNITKIVSTPLNGGQDISSPGHLTGEDIKNRDPQLKAKTPTPGFLGTPAGMTTISAPIKIFFNPSSAGKRPSTFAGVAMCDRSAATPGVLTISKSPN